MCVCVYMKAGGGGVCVYVCREVVCVWREVVCVCGGRWCVCVRVCGGRWREKADNLCPGTKYYSVTK